MVVAELLTRLGFEVDPRELNRGIDRAKSSLSGFKSFLGKLALGYSFYEVGAHVLKTARYLETMSVQLETFTGSAANMQKLFRGIVDYAKQTHFYVADISQAVVKMSQGGVPTEAIMPKIKQLGDISSSGPQLKALGFTYGRIYSHGFMNGQELLMMQRSGNFAPLMQLARKQAEAAGLMKKGDEVAAGSKTEKFIQDRMAVLRDMVKHQQFTVAMLNEAIDYSTTKGGMYFEHQAKQVKTFEGAWTNMLDVLQINAALALQKLFPLFKKLMIAVTEIPFDWLERGFTRLAQWVDDLWAALKAANIAVYIDMVKSAFADLFSELSPNKDFLKELIGYIVTAAKAALFLMAGLVELTRAVVAVTKWLWEHKLAAAALATLLLGMLLPAMTMWAKRSTGMFGILTNLGTIVMWFTKNPLTTMMIVIEQLTPKIAAMWKCLAGGGVALPAIAAILFVANAVNVLLETLAENKALADSKEYAEGVTRIVQKKMANKAALKALEGRGNQYDSERDELQRRIAGNDKELSDLRAKHGVSAPPVSTVDPGIAALNEKMDKLLGKTDDGNESLGKIAGNTTPKGTVPNDVLRLAEMSFRTRFVINGEAERIALAAE